MAGRKPDRINRESLGVALDAGDPALAATEVRRLWLLLDGAGLSPAFREGLARSWGFCPRHTWAYAIVECAYRLRPLVTTTIYEDLARRAARALSLGIAPSTRSSVRRLESDGECPACDHSSGRAGGVTWTSRAERVNRREQFEAELEATRPEWEKRSCPLCLGGDGPICRPHLLAGARPTEDLADGLASLADRLGALMRSFMWPNEPVTARERASWVEALGWFAGWDYPRRLGRR